jgi:hypothetical protein
MAVVVASIQDLTRQYWPQFFGGLLGISSGTTSAGHWNPLIKSFKIGRGGWIDPGTGKVPRTPDPTLTDLDIIVDYSRPLISQRYIPTLTGNIMFMEKTLTGADFTFVGPSSLQIRCLLDFGDFNDIQGTPSNPPGGGVLAPAGVNPDLWELGIFCDHPSGTGELMLFYGTFVAETKTNAKQIENDVLVTF